MQIWCLSQHIFVKKHFYQELKRFGPSYFLSSTGNLGPPRAKSLQNGGLSFLPSWQKIKPVTTHKMASHLMGMNIIFQENMCLTDPNHYKHSKMTIFYNALTQESIGTVFGGVQQIGLGVVRSPFTYGVPVDWGTVISPPLLDLDIFETPTNPNHCESLFTPCTAAEQLSGMHGRQTICMCPWYIVPGMWVWIQP